MGKLLLIKIKDGIETILEETAMPDGLLVNGFGVFHPPGYIEKLEKHYAKTGKPKKSHIDVIYITRLQVERR